jgi:hypothetical protein
MLKSIKSAARNKKKPLAVTIDTVVSDNFKTYLERTTVTTKRTMITIHTQMKNFITFGKAVISSYILPPYLNF